MNGKHHDVMSIGQSCCETGTYWVLPVQQCHKAAISLVDHPPVRPLEEKRGKNQSFYYRHTRTWLIRHCKQKRQLTLWTSITI